MAGVGDRQRSDRLPTGLVHHPLGIDPTYNVEVTKQPGGPSDGQGDVAFKVGVDGKPVPKGPSDVNNPYDKGTNPEQNKAYETEVMEQGHLKAKPEPPP
jgi:hypothetical protein